MAAAQAIRVAAMVVEATQAVMLLVGMYRDPAVQDQVIHA